MVVPSAVSSRPRTFQIGRLVVLSMVAITSLLKSLISTRTSILNLFGSTLLDGAALSSLYTSLAKETRLAGTPQQDAFEGHCYPWVTRLQRVTVQHTTPYILLLIMLFLGLSLRIQFASASRHVTKPLRRPSAVPMY